MEKHVLFYRSIEQKMAKLNWHDIILTWHETHAPAMQSNSLSFSAFSVFLQPWNCKSSYEKRTDRFTKLISTFLIASNLLWIWVRGQRRLQHVKRLKILQVIWLPWTAQDCKPPINTRHPLLRRPTLPWDKIKMPTRHTQLNLHPKTMG